MQRRSPNKIGAWELLLLLMTLAVLSLSFGNDDAPEQPVTGYTNPHLQKPLSDADFLDGAVLVKASTNDAKTQEAGR